MARCTMIGLLLLIVLCDACTQSMPPGRHPPRTPDEIRIRKPYIKIATEGPGEVRYVTTDTGYEIEKVVVPVAEDGYVYFVESLPKCLHSCEYTMATKTLDVSELVRHINKVKSCLGGTGCSVSIIDPPGTEIKLDQPCSCDFALTVKQDFLTDDTGVTITLESGESIDLADKDSNSLAKSFDRTVK